MNMTTQGMTMNGKLLGLAIISILVACEPAPQMLELPNTASDSSICNDVAEASGGDMVDMVDRILVGKVTRVSFVEEGLAEICDPRLYEWTLRVELSVVENLKGTGDSEVVLVNPDFLQWNSLPVMKRDGTWVPQRSVAPAVELTDTFGWTNEAGIQEGQTLIIFARERDGVLFTSGMPWASGESDVFRFQTPLWCTMTLPKTLSAEFGLETLRKELKVPAKVGTGGDTYMQSGYITESFCKQATRPPPYEEIPDAGN